MLDACWLWFVISKEYVELTRLKIESRDPIFFTGTRSRSRVSGNDRLFPRGSEFGSNPEIPASPVIQLRPRPVHLISDDSSLKRHTFRFKLIYFCDPIDILSRSWRHDRCRCTGALNQQELLINRYNAWQHCWLVHSHLSCCLEMEAMPVMTYEV